MLDTFKVRLKALSKDFKAQNLTQKRIDAFADRLNKKFPDITDEAEHDNAIKDLNELISFEDIAKEDDRVRTLEKKTQTQKTPEEIAAEEETKRKEGDMPDWFKTYKEETDRKLSAFENEKKQGSIKSTLSSKLKEIPAAFYENWQLPDSEDKIDEFVTKAQASFDAVKQSFTEKGLAWTPGGGTGGNNNKEATKEEVKGMVDKIMPK